MNPLLTLANTVNVIKTSGLGEPYSTSDYVVAGTVIQWGGNVSSEIGGRPSLDQIRDVMTALQATGRFSNVQGDYTGVFNLYVSLTLTSAIDRAHLEDVLRDIEGYFYQAGLNASTNAFWIASVPASAANNSNVAQAGTGASNPPVVNRRGAGSSGAVVPGNQQVNAVPTPCPNPSLFCQCGYEFSLFDMGCVPVGDPTTTLDKLAKSLGVTPTQAAVVGALGALLAVIAIGKIVK